MNEEIGILAELAGFNSPLAGISRQMPYGVPEGYFAALPDRLAERAMHAYLPDAAGTQPYTTPDGYFENLPETIIAQLQEEAPQLPQAALPFAAPEGYFEQLPDALLQRAREEEQAAPAGRSITFRPRNQRRAWMRAAAVLVVVLSSLGVYRAVQQHKVQGDINLQLASISGDALTEYVNLHIDDYELEDILETGNHHAHAGEAPGALAPPISDNEIIEYLNENGWE